ncbi:MAG: hypothetical protein ACUVTX_04940 [Bacteroidales bacterium]
MNRLLFRILIISLLNSILASSCMKRGNNLGRIPVARAGDKILYYDQIPEIYKNGVTHEDSIVSINNYLNEWAKRELMYAKAVENITPAYKNEIENQLQETKINLYIYHYQHQMMLEKMDTVVKETEMESYYAENGDRFRLNSSIVKALFIKIPLEAPNIERVTTWYTSNDSEALRQLESYCFQFAEKYDDFGEEWVSFDKLAFELPSEILNPEEFLRRYTYYETRDSLYAYFTAIRDYRLRSTAAPYEYVKNDIKNIILNNRRFEFLKSLENDIYKEAVKTNYFRKY